MILNSISRTIAIALAVSIFAVIRAPGAPVRMVDEAPVNISKVAPGVILVDFGRVAFGNLCFPSPPQSGKPRFIASRSTSREAIAGGPVTSRQGEFDLL